MSIQVGGRRQELFLVDLPFPKAAAMVRCVELTVFKTMATKVSEPNVDTAGKDASLSSQEGF